MRLVQLETLIAVGEELHFGRAASRLSLRTSTVSTQISHLEAEYGVALFIRDSRNVQLTNAGLALLIRARQILDEVRDLEVTARQLAQPHSFTLTIGAFDEGLAEIADVVTTNYQAKFPRSVVTWAPLEYDNISGALNAGRVDLVLASLPAAWFAERETTHTPLFSESRCAVLPRRHPLAAQEEIHSSRLLEETFLKVDAPTQMHTFFTLADRRDRSVTPDVDVEATHLHDLLNHVAAGVGIFTTTTATARFYRRPDIAYVPVPDLEPGTLHVLNAKDDRRPHVLAFIEVCVNAVRTSLDLVPTAVSAVPGSER